MKFTKMHGLGNDYIYVNGFEEKIENPSVLSIEISNRHFGIGSDGLILVLPSIIADFKMSMFNADGSEGKMCGNGIRCVGKYVYDEKMTSKNIITIETLAGIKTLELTIENEKVSLVKVDMGEPMFESKKIPINCDKEKFIKEEIRVAAEKYYITCLSMGNPHCVIYMDNINDLEIEKIGPLFENNILFPDRINTEFVNVIDRNTLQMRVWERGSGETLACGTGACAAAVASIVNGFSERSVKVKLLGGELFIEWNEADNHVYMTGTATKVFEGIW